MDLLHKHSEDLGHQNKFGQKILANKKTDSKMSDDAYVQVEKENSKRFIELREEAATRETHIATMDAVQMVHDHADRLWEQICSRRRHASRRTGNKSSLPLRL